MGRIGWALLGLVTNSSAIVCSKIKYRSREPSSRRRSTLPAGLVSTREGTQVRKPLLVANWQSDLVVHENNSLLFDLPHVLLSTQRSRRFTRTTRLTTKPQWIVSSGWSRGRWYRILKLFLGDQEGNACLCSLIHHCLLGDRLRQVLVRMKTWGG